MGLRLDLKLCNKLSVSFITFIIFTIIISVQRDIPYMLLMLWMEERETTKRSHQRGDYQEESESLM